MNNLAENQFGHGAKVHSKPRILARRAWRARNSRYRGGAAPFDWNTPFNSKPGIKVKNQFQSSSCGGQSYSYAAEVIFGAECSAKSFYSRGVADGGGMDDSVYRNLADNAGICLEKDVPSYRPDGTTDEQWMTDTSWQNFNSMKDAATRSGMVDVNVPIDIDSIAQAVNKYGHVILLIEGQNGNNPNFLSPYPSVPSKSNHNPLWGHYICVLGYQTVNNEKQIDYVNSWGDSIGDAGWQHFKELWIDSGYIVDAFSFTKKLSFSRELSYGNVGMDVFKLQQYLVKNGFANFIPTGFFGTKTGQAVVQWQQTHGIQPTAPRLGPQSLALINKIYPN